MTFDTVKLQQEQSLAILTLNRPDRLNSINATMRQELMTVLTRLAADTSVRAVLITGAGRAFCAGQDLHERRRAPGEPRADLGQSLRQGYNPIARAIRSLDKPVVCAVNGVAAGAGANLALACDLVVAKRSARFIQSFINIGLIPDCGGTWSLARKVGHARATGLAMTGTPIGAEQAVEWGLIWQCYPDESFGRDALQLGLELARKPTRALAAIKSALAGAYHNTFDEQLALEAEYQQRCGQSDDYQEGLQAFFDKRAPAFRGR
ncbi:2-(1,2-epoxy-1,2-dihydrophenyl)acetyl-CoA isomerase [Marinobacter lutaoensis]|uniref:2-(1,2-epoxy-1,2-dihydrophenyl)acetyl-CoA isomerase n=1 Tax=Marinobacter lutaoensis TaxID=135739 RepID=A0A1V2DVW3_9GAMM|nr:2-(1,2-epoxy-1,2-dihydrophenyl)acetyl-CoA isomerase PaaG [Marinobacter lutaoensis]ONF44894.1 2-(1,2-epoxy-1,2-dihydrophenyl)acetyl-CoA isomerase [Marinobacter lutaoensis]